ncbi:IS5 family transposase [Yoonia sp. SS1-5]|uniref:IS5 family transposase n=1 Tax=Yoonia rhodophyticola TaxID=3137370 RepID=A0ABZ3JBM5_9RHOB
MARFDLTDFEWSVIEPLLPTKVRGVKRRDDRQVLNGIFWRLRTGAPWADIPARYGPYTTCVNRFNRWRRAGHWARILGAISEAYEGDVQMIDSSSIRVHQQGANGQKGGRSDCMGRSRGGLTTKIHALVDAVGRPIRLMLSAGQAYDGHAAMDLLDALPPACKVLADRAYDSNAIRAMIAAQKAAAVIPSMPHRNPVIPYDAEYYKERNWVERFFNKLKNFRAVATRYDKRDDNFLASVQLASIRIWLRSYESVA